MGFKDTDIVFPYPQEVSIAIPCFSIPFPKDEKVPMLDEIIRHMEIGSFWCDDRPFEARYKYLVIPPNGNLKAFRKYLGDKNFLYTLYIEGICWAIVLLNIDCYYMDCRAKVVHLMPIKEINAPDFTEEEKEASYLFDPKYTAFLSKKRFLDEIPKCSDRSVERKHPAKVQDLLDNLASDVMTNSSFSQEVDIYNTLLALQKIKAETPKVHDEIIAAATRYQELFKAFPEWEDKYMIQQHLTSCFKMAGVLSAIRINQRFDSGFFLNTIFYLYLWIRMESPKEDVILVRDINYFMKQYISGKGAHAHFLIQKYSWHVEITDDLPICRYIGYKNLKDIQSKSPKSAYMIIKCAEKVIKILNHGIAFKIFYPLIDSEIKNDQAHYNLEFLFNNLELIKYFEGYGIDLKSLVALSCVCSFVLLVELRCYKEKNAELYGIDGPAKLEDLVPFNRSTARTTIIRHPTAVKEYLENGLSLEKMYAIGLHEPRWPHYYNDMILYSLLHYKNAIDNLCGYGLDFNFLYEKARRGGMCFLLRDLTRNSDNFINFLKFLKSIPEYSSMSPYDLLNYDHLFSVLRHQEISEICIKNGLKIEALKDFTKQLYCHGIGIFSFLERYQDKIFPLRGPTEISQILEQMQSDPRHDMLVCSENLECKLMTWELDEALKKVRGEEKEQAHIV